MRTIAIVLILVFAAVFTGCNFPLIKTETTPQEKVVNVGGIPYDDPFWTQPANMGGPGFGGSPGVEGTGAK